MDLVERYRANPSVTRQLLQTIELTVFDAYLGGSAYLSPAFDHLFTAEHRYLLNASLRCLGEISGTHLYVASSPILGLDFTRGNSTRDHDAPS